MVRFFALQFLLLAASSNAFSPAATNNHLNQLQRVSSSSASSVVVLQAADGAPQYDKIDAVLTSAEKVAEGSYMLHVQVVPTTTTSSDVEEDVQQRHDVLDYQPGHVIALEMKDDSSDLNEDAKKNGGWMRGPYTVSRCSANDSSLDVLVRVVGKKSKAFSEASPGTSFRFGGKFKVPILEGINPKETKKVVFISTGVGIGPCVGAIEQALLLTESSFPPIALLASYKETDEVAYREHLDDLVEQHPTKLEWTPVVTSQTGRISSNDETMRMVQVSIQDLGISETHYHLIGNGQMVNEWKAGLEKAGVPEERVTTEQYFNHKAETSTKAIDTIAAAITSACAVQA